MNVVSSSRQSPSSGNLPLSGLSGFSEPLQFEELLDGADESDNEADAMAEIAEMLYEIEATDSFQVEGDNDDTSMHLGHIDPNARMFRK